MLVILFISTFEYTYFLKSVFLSIYHIHFLGQIFIYNTSFGPYTYKDSFPKESLELHYEGLDTKKDRVFSMSSKESFFSLYRAFSF